MAEMGLGSRWQRGAPRAPPCLVAAPSPEAQGRAWPWGRGLPPGQDATGHLPSVPGTGPGTGMGRLLLPWAAARLPCPLGAGGHNLPHVPSLLSGLGVWVGELSLGVVPNATGSPRPCAFLRPMAGQGLAGPCAGVLGTPRAATCPLGPTVHCHRHGSWRGGDQPRCCRGALIPTVWEGGTWGLGWRCHSPLSLQCPVTVPKAAWAGMGRGYWPSWGCCLQHLLSISERDCVVLCWANTALPEPGWALGPAAAFCHGPAQLLRSAGALESLFGGGDPRAGSAEPVLSPAPPCWGPGSLSPTVLWMVWLSGTPHNPPK